VAWIGSAHHVARVEALSGDLGDRQLAVINSVFSSKRCKTHQKEVKTREGNQVDSKLSEIAVELSGITEGARGPCDCIGDQMIQVAVIWSCQLEGSEANIVQRFVIESETLVGVLDELVDDKVAL